MKALMVAALTFGLLGAPLSAYPQGPPNPFENTSKRTLWDTGQRYRQKWHDCGDDLQVEGLQLTGCRRKLATRTSTAIRNMVVPPAVPTPEGWSTEFVLGIGLGCFAIGAILGAILARPSQPSVIVAK